MKNLGQRLYQRLRGSILHPQWLTDRFHIRIRNELTVQRGKLILDIGSGTRNTDRLFSDNTLIRLDYPATNSRYQHRPDVYGDAQQLPIASNSVDMVLLLEVLEHIPRPGMVIKEIHRVLRPSGKLFLSAPFIYPIHDAPFDFQRFTIYGLRRILEENGLALNVTRQNGNPFLVSIQLVNLSLLALCKFLWERFAVVGMFAVLLAYPLCLANNIIALPFTWLPDKGASCFGYFVVAERK